jgi:hypothetical protein
MVSTARVQRMLVHLVYLVYLVCLVDQTENSSRITRQTRETRQPDRRARARCTSTVARLVCPPIALQARCYPSVGRAPRWSTCGRRTRPFRGRAFREHRTNVGALPILFIVRVLRARKTSWLFPQLNDPSKLARYLSRDGG